jgi:hypothetical protein
MRISVLIKLYEVKAAARKDLEVFAVQDLKRETRIMCERSLIHLTRRSVMNVLGVFAKLSSNEQALFLSLCCRSLGDRDAERSSIMRTQQSLELSAETFSVEEQIKIMAIYDTNAFEAGEESIICPEASRINHSCVPNVHHCWNSSIGRETVHAVRDIAAGEEILTTYVSICIGQGERKKQLSHYDFTCDCPACDTSTAYGGGSENRRTRLFRIDQELAMHSTMSYFSSFSNDKKALYAVLEYVKLLQKKRIENMKLTRTCVHPLCFD